MLNDLIHYGTSDFNINASNGSTAIKFETGSSEKMRITSTGNVGIGTTLPQTKLAIGSAQGSGIDFLYDATNNYKNQIKNYWNSGTDTRMDFNIGRTSGVTPVTVMSVGYNGNVGIGTTTPLAKLDVQGTQGQLFSVTDNLSGEIFAVADISGVPIFKINSSELSTFTGLVSGITPVNAANFVTKAYVDGGGGAGSGFLPLSAGSGFPLTGDLYVSDDVLPVTNITSNLGSSTNSFLYTHTYVVQSAGVLQLNTGGTERMRIDSAGNVGIGSTSTTAAKLVVDSDTAPQILVKNSGGGNAQILFEDNSGNTQNASITFDQAGQNALYITTGYDSPSDLNRIYFQPGGETAMTIRGGNNATGKAGNVGIGTTSPTEKLEVAGNIKIQSALLSNQENTDVDTGTETIAEVATATYTAAFFDFVVKKSTNVRSGTVYACHNGDTTPLVEFTETSTQDLGDTSDVVLSVDISGTNMRLRATVASDDWSIKSLIRAI